MPLSRVSLVRLMPFLLLVCGLVGLVFWATEQKTAASGPSLMTRGADGSVWLAINRRLYITSAAGESLQQIDLTALNVPLPLRALAALKDGSVVVAGGDVGRLFAISPSGLARPVAYVRGAKGNLRLAVSPGSGDILVSDSSNHRLLLLDPEGQELLGSGQSMLDLRYPDEVVFMPDGTIAVADTDHQRILMSSDHFRPVGMIPVCTPEPCDGLFRWPSSLEILGNGHLVVSVLDDRMERGQLLQLDAQGHRRGLPQLPDGAQPTAILAMDGGYLVADRGNLRILRFSEQGLAKSDFGDFTIQAALEQTAVDREFYRKLILVGQFALLTVLALLVLLHARGVFVRYPAGMNGAVPGGPSGGLFGKRVLLLFLNTMAWSFPLTVLLVLLTVILRFSRLMEAESIVWTYLAVFPLLFLLPSLIASQSLARHGVHGTFTPLWQSAASRIYGRYRPLLKQALPAGEKVEWYALSLHRRGTRLLVLSATRFIVLTLSQNGGGVMGFSYVPRISLSKVGKGPLKRNFFLRLLLPIPLYRVRFLAGNQTHELLLPDLPTATVLADQLRGSARGIGPADADPIELPVGSLAYSPASSVLAVAVSIILPGAGQLVQQRLGAGLFFLLAWGAAAVALIPMLNTLMGQLREVPMEVLLPSLGAAFVVWLLALLDTLLLSPDRSRLAAY